MCVYDNGKGVKTILVVVVVVVQLHKHNSLTGLAISTKLCEYIDFHLEMCIGILIFCKQCSACKKKQPQAIHYDRDINMTITCSY